MTSSKFALAIAASAGLGAFSNAQSITEDFILTPDDGVFGDYFGYAVDLLGDATLVGALGTNDLASDSGSAYLFNTSTGQQLMEFLPGNTTANQYFGHAVSLLDGLAIVGAWGDADNGANSGAVYVFDQSTGQLLQKLHSNSSQPVALFGYSMDAQGQVLLVGAPGHGNSGKVYVYDTSTWIERTRLNIGGIPNGRFGTSVAVWGTQALVGAPEANQPFNNTGGAFLFDLVTEELIYELLPSDSSGGDFFGHAVAIGETRIAISSFMQNSSVRGVYLFDRATGVEIAKLVPGDLGQSPGVGAGFGSSLALSGDTLIVGANWDSELIPSGGAAYLFDAVTGTPGPKLAPNDGASTTLMFFGDAVAFDGTRAAVGSTFPNSGGLDPGAVYLYGVPENRGTSTCFGDGSGSLCPCGANGNQGEGCANSTGTGGAQLEASGNAWFGWDSFALNVTGMPSLRPGLCIKGSVGFGNGNPIGDGLLCTSPQLRSQVLVSDNAGSLHMGTWRGQSFGGFPGAANAGTATYYQWWYRDPQNNCSGQGFNFSNDWEATWMP